MKRTRQLGSGWVVAVAGLALAAGLGCEQKDGGDKGGKGDTASTAAKSAAPAAAGKSWEDLKAELDKTFAGVNTANAGDVDAAIAKFKTAVGAPARTEGSKDFWYGKDKSGQCMEAWTLKGGGFGSNGADATRCK